MFITAAILKRKDACATQLALFRQLFPEGVDVTEAVCVSVADKFDWDWAAQHLLPEPPLAAYRAKCAALWADYQAKRAALWADYQAKDAPLWADYQAKRAPLWADYQAKRAPLFGRLAETVE